jgi:hypothetical protein
VAGTGGVRRAPGSRWARLVKGRAARRGSNPPGNPYGIPERRRVSRRRASRGLRQGKGCQFCVTALLGLAGRDVGGRLEQAAVAEPIDPFKSGDLDAPGAARDFALRALGRPRLSEESMRARARAGRQATASPASRSPGTPRKRWASGGSATIQFRPGERPGRGLPSRTFGPESERFPGGLGRHERAT